MIQPRPSAAALSKITLTYFLMASASVHATSDSVTPDSLSSLDELGIVLTPSRLKQPLSDSPASTSIITDVMIRSLGIRKIPELFRLVPGMVVTQAAGNDYRVSYHGGSSSQPRRMQVLIDGASVYLGGLARVSWSSLPITVEDIQRVEVVRNPAAASYGANAFQAVINIITKDPAQTFGSSGKGSVGSDGHSRWRFSHGSLRQSVSVWGLRDDGFDTNYQEESRRDGEEMIGVRYKGLFSPSPSSTLGFTAGYTHSKLDVEFQDPRQTTFPDKDQEDLFLVADYNINTSQHSDWRVLASFYGSDQRQEWGTCYENILYTDEAARLYDANPGYVDSLRAGAIPSGGSDLDDTLLMAVLQRMGSLGAQALALNCGEIDQDLKDLSTRIEIQNTWRHTRNLVSVTGIGVHYVAAKSKTLFDGTENGRTNYAFYNGQYRWKAWTINAGGMIEHTPRLEDELDVSYRAAANWRITPENTFRIAYANATRTPDLFESDRKWSFTANNLDSPINGASSRRILSYYPDNTIVESAEIESVEAAYVYRSAPGDLQFQARVFRDELRNLNSSRINFFNTDVSPAGKSTLKGAELEIRYSLGDATRIGLGYAYLDGQYSVQEESDLDYSHSGHVYVTHSFNDIVTASIAHYGSNEISGRSFNKTDLSLLFSINQQFSADLVLSNRPKRNDFTASSGFVVENNYEESTAIIAGIEYTF